MYRPFIPYTRYDVRIFHHIMIIFSLLSYVRVRNKVYSQIHIIYNIIICERWPPLYTAISFYAGGLLIGRTHRVFSTRIRKRMLVSATSYASKTWTKECVIRVKSARWEKTRFMVNNFSRATWTGQRRDEAKGQREYGNPSKN